MLLLTKVTLIIYNQISKVKMGGRIMNEITSYKRIGTEPHRSYYIPFDYSDTTEEIYGITDRRSSSRFISLDGKWQIKDKLHNSGSRTPTAPYRPIY